eukprot:TRINITY_DN13547_c0_g2_i1.p1 TRINITY_DN13547_c0_g2~~TRINITY_DN13547_c0_g2_i1.p1  ORF type:complete len:400 (-),score=64.17 TRINITY_DN13547_c0_g2_i1:106-1305(-)
MIRRPPRSTLSSSSAASDVYKRQEYGEELLGNYGAGHDVPLNRPRANRLSMLRALSAAALLLAAVRSGSVRKLLSRRPYTIPTIDLAHAKIACDDEAWEMAARWSDAFERCGLVYLTNHGLGHLYRAVAEEWRLFCAMPAEEKHKFSSARYGECGWNRIGKETVGLSDGGAVGGVDPDPVESLENGYSAAFGGNFPRAENGYARGDRLRDACVALYQALDDEVVRPCLELASMALRIPPESGFETLWFQEGEGAYQLRLAKYFAERSPQGSEMLYGEHTDYDGFTFLWRSASNGLEAEVDGRWVSVPVPSEDPDCLVINLGDLMQFWTNGLWKSPKHRVRRLSGSGDELVSLVFFAGPHERTQLRRLNSPMVLDDRDGIVLTAGEHVQAKIASTAMIVD